MSRNRKKYPYPQQKTTGKFIRNEIMWQKINAIGVDELENTRIHLHKTLQLLSSAARSYLPYSRTDENRYLKWKTGEHIFVSRPFGENFQIQISLDIHRFILSINKKDGTREHLVLSGMTYPLAFGWLQVKLDKFGLDPVQFTDHAPYEIKDYRFEKDQELNISEAAAEEFCKYFDNAQHYFEYFLEKHHLSSTIICDPASFNLFINIKHPETGKKIELGFCPGDENYIEPYFYLKLEHSIQSTSGLPELPKGLWHNRGWSGALILFSDITNIEVEREYANVKDFFDASLKASKDLV